MPASLAADADAILGDFVVGTTLRLRLGFLADEFYEDTGVVWVVDDTGYGFGFGLHVSGRRGDTLTAIANGIQEYISEFADTWGAALPPCPGHSHPMSSVAQGDTAWWVCPLTGKRLRPLGVYEAGPGLKSNAGEHG